MVVIKGDTTLQKKDVPVLCSKLAPALMGWAFLLHFDAQKCLGGGTSLLFPGLSLFSGYFSRYAAS